MSGISGAVGLAAFSSNTCAIVTSGKVKCWGANSLGQIGDGTTAEYTSAVQSSLTKSAASVSALLSAGTQGIIASYSGNGAVAASVSSVVQQTVNKASQTITFAEPAGTTFGASPTTLQASVGSGLPIGFASETTGVCTVAGTTATIVGAGTCTITASQGGNGNYLAANDVQQSFDVAKAAQTIAFDAPADTTFGASPLTLAASVGSGLPISFVSETTDVCTVAGATATIVGAGTCTITASQGGNGNYLAANDIQQSFDVAKAAQTIAFDAPADITFGASPVTLLASVNSGLPISFTSETTNVCTVAGATTTIVGAGTCTITALQGGNGNYLAANDVQQSFTVAKAAQTIGFDAPADTTFGASPVALVASVGSGLPISFASEATDVCTVAGATATIVGAGTCTITASQGGNENYLAAADVSRSFLAAKAGQTISYTKPEDTTFGAAPVTLVASVPAGLAISFASETTDVCTVAGATAAIVGAGTCTITASQGGNDNYLAAADVSQSFKIAKATQTISFPPMADASLGAPPVPLGATASSGLAVSYASATPTICTVADAKVSLVAVGVCSLTASQAGQRQLSTGRGRHGLLHGEAGWADPDHQLHATGRHRLRCGSGPADGDGDFEPHRQLHVRESHRLQHHRRQCDHPRRGDLHGHGFAGGQRHLCAGSARGEVLRGSQGADLRGGDRSGIADRPAGAPVPVTARVAAIAPGGGVPDGVVTFSEGTTVYATPTLVQGKVTASLTTQISGSHAVKVSYAGSANFLPSDDGTVFFVDPRIGGPIIVDEVSARERSHPTVTRLTNGTSLVVWDAGDDEDSGSGLLGRRYDAAGKPVGTAFRIGQGRCGDVGAPTVAALPRGRFVVAWQTDARGRFGTDIALRWFDDLGRPAGEAVVVNETRIGWQSRPTLAALADGDILVGWQSARFLDATASIRARRYAGTGVARGREMRVDVSDRTSQTAPTVVALPDGGYAFAYVSATPGQISSARIVGRVYTAANLPVQKCRSATRDGRAGTGDGGDRGRQSRRPVVGCGGIVPEPRDRGAAAAKGTVAGAARHAHPARWSRRLRHATHRGELPERRLRRRLGGGGQNRRGGADGALRVDRRRGGSGAGGSGAECDRGDGPGDRRPVRYGVLDDVHRRHLARATADVTLQRFGLGAPGL